MTNPIERTAAAMQRAMAASPEERERLRQAAEDLGAARSDCDHHWTFHLKGGEPLSVGVCTMCGEPNWGDLRRQLSELDGATEPGPENSYPSTPGEFAARWNAKSEEQRAEWLAASVEDAETAMICRAMHRRRRDDAVRFATGGYIQGPPPPLGGCLPVVVHPDDCLIGAGDVRAGRLVCSRPGHPTATSDCAPTTDLPPLCRAHGMADEDSARAIATYTALGRLTAHDRVRLAGMSEAERSTALAARYGADAARVAQIDYARRAR